MDSLLSTNTTGTNGQSTLHELFALTDEQILEIVPEAETAVGRDPSAVARGEEANRPVVQRSPQEGGEAPRGELAIGPSEKTAQASSVAVPEHGTRSKEHEVEPPPWLSSMMKDPWNGEEAREFWQGIQQVRQETAAFREVFAKPEDARALKELYPGGVNEARGAVERARVLDDIDRAYFGAAGGSAEQTTAARAQLAQTMMREDPAAFREMVFAGLRALESAGNSTAPKSVAQAFRPEGVRAFKSEGVSSVERATSAGKPLTPEGVSYSGVATASVVGAQPAAAGALPGNAAAGEAQIAAYAAFEKSANDDLERTVGAAIGRTLEQALPNTGRSDTAPLKGRLAATIRQDVEAALKGDRQLGEQIGQILSARRFDVETRAQVVRLIDERARQLVPTAAKRVLNDWTQTTLSAHRGQTARADVASARREVAPASLPAGPSGNAPPGKGRLETGATPQRVDYRKFSDEQILEM